MGGSTSPDYLNLKEVAEFLRLKERKLYDLVREGRIPCVKVTGKWLFPRAEIEGWVRSGGKGPGSGSAGRRDRPLIVAGSRDPLLDWAIAQSGSGLATVGGGSLAGLDRLLEGEAVAAGLHVLDVETDGYNTHLLEGRPEASDLVLIEWAKREQGVVVPPGNPRGLTGVGDAIAKGARFARRQKEAGASVLFEALAAREAPGVAPVLSAETCQSGLEVGLAVLDGRADCGIAVRAVARRLHLDFVPLATERFDLLVDRRAYFEPPLQTLFAFARTPAFADRAADLLGYDVAETGTVRWNG